MALSTPASLPPSTVEKGEQQASRGPFPILAWVVILLVSLLPEVMVNEVLHLSIPWLFYAKLGLLAVLVVVSFVWKPARLLGRFFAVLLALYTLEEFTGRLAATPIWQAWFSQGASTPFTLSMLGIQVSRLLVSFLMIAVLLLLGYHRADFFLAWGNLRAQIRPVPWLGFPKPDAWTHFGGQWAAYIPIGTLVFLLLAGMPTPNQVLNTLPMLPGILILAGMNAFSEELCYRSALLAALEKPLGSRNAVWMAAVFFGIGHYYGVPYGILGVLMATFLGWMLGKAMVETRGFFWAWWIHFLQDVAIFFFMALGTVIPGGG